METLNKKKSGTQELRKKSLLAKIAKKYPSFKIVILFTTILTTLLITIPLKAEPSEKLSSLLSQSFEDFETLEATFTQEKKLELLQDVLESSGHIKIKKPSSFLWVIKEPFLQKIAFTNQTVSIQDEDNPPQKISIEKLAGLKELFLLLLNLMQNQWSQLEQNFDYELKQQNPVILILTPKKALFKHSFQTITLYQDPDQKWIRQINLTESNGDTLQMRFKDIQKNHSIPSEDFEL